MKFTKVYILFARLNNVEHQIFQPIVAFPLLIWPLFVCLENKEIAESKAADEPLKWGDLQKMKLSWRAVQESMRLMPPVQASFRVAPHEMSFNGFRIPKSWKVKPRYQSQDKLQQHQIIRSVGSIKTSDGLVLNIS